jgi:hypothetical protein
MGKHEIPVITVSTLMTSASQTKGTLIIRDPLAGSGLFEVMVTMRVDGVRM